MDILLRIIEISLTVAGFFGLLWCSSSVSPINIGMFFNECLFLVFENTAALSVFVLFILVVNNAFAGVISLKGISNHIILSLEIICLFSSIMLILFQSFKDPRTSFCKV